MGGSQFEVACSEARLLLDSGTGKNGKDSAPPRQPKGNVDAIALSHCHIDHSGLVPAHYKHRPAPLYATAPTLPLCSILWEDSLKIALQEKKTPPISQKEIRLAEKHFTPLPYGEECELYDGTTVSLHDAGHITGSAQVLVRSKNSSLLYSGDFNLAESRLHSPAVIPKGVDALIVESTYANRDHPPRKETEKLFVLAVEEALEDGNVLIPAFAVDRTQEMLCVLHAHRVEAKLFVDGMGIKTSAVAGEYPSYFRDYNLLASALRRTSFVESGSERKRISEGRGKVIIATAGMLDGGPALSYLQRLNSQGNGAVFLTGFQAADTNGRRLVERSEVVDRGKRVKVSLPVRAFDFSAHSGRSELFEYVRRVQPEKVFCVHGDEGSCGLFARELREEGFDAQAPELGQEVKT